MTRFRIEWGLGSILALPLALSFLPRDDFGWTSASVHIGPIFVAFEWSNR